MSSEPSGADGCLTTIQAGIDATPPGGIVDIGAGVYYEALTVPAEKIGLTIRGSNAKKVRIKGLPVIEDSPAIDILADDVTIESLSIESPAQEGILSSNAGTTIRRVNLLATGRECIDVDGANALIEDSNAIGCDGDGIQVDAVNATIRRVNIERVDGNCIDQNGAGLVIDRVSARFCGDEGFNIDGDDVSVTNSTLAGSPGEECLLSDGANTLIENNTFSMCEGAASIRGEGMQVLKNKFSGSFNGKVRVQCDGDCGSARVSGNSISAISGDGLSVSVTDGIGGIVVEDNQISNATNDGITVSGASVTLRGNGVKNCGTSGFHAGFDINGTDHVIENNTVSDQRGAGYNVGGSGHTLSGNVARRNLGDDFNIRSTSINASLNGNAAIGNTGTGFEIDAGADSTSLANNVGVKNRADFCDEGTNTFDGGDNKFLVEGACAVD